ncbi:MAG: hypothetical protein HFE04_03645 [Bacilli bacterium]|nr:hypothetical protein [Bacilli bacterium]
MTRKNKVIVLSLSIISILLFLVVVLYFSIVSLKKYIPNVLFKNINGAIFNSKVLKNEIGDIDKAEFQLFPVFSYEYDNYVRKAKLSYKITTKDGNVYNVLISTNPTSYSNVYSYQIDDKILYEHVDVYDKFLNNVEVDGIS